MTNSVPSEPTNTLPNSTEAKVNSLSKPEGDCQTVGTQKPLLNGDVVPGPAPRVEMESKVTGSDQVYQPPVKMARLENNLEGPGLMTQQRISTAPQFMETQPSAVKPTKMAPSPVPSAEESSLSNDFAEENSGNSAVDPLKTIITQITTTTSTTTTTSVSHLAEVSRSSKPVETATESAVSTLTTMTKTTVTKVRSPTPDSQSDESQSETVTHEHKTTLSSSISKSSSGPHGSTSSRSTLALSQEISATSTKGRVRLLKFSRTKKTRSDTALPSYRKFVTKSKIGRAHV